jgi:hypothetical protein
MNKHNIDFLKLDLLEIDAVDIDQIKYLILENRISPTSGHSRIENQTMFFKNNNVELGVEYAAYVVGSIESDPGDYLTPSYTDVEIKEIDIYIKLAYIEGEEIILTPEISSILVNKIKSELTKNF